MFDPVSILVVLCVLVIMAGGMFRTSPMVFEVATWEGDEPVLNCVGGAVLTITPPDDFRILRIAINFSAAVAPTVTITQINATGALWNQVIRQAVLVAPAAGTTQYTLVGGIGYEYAAGDSIQVTITAVAANAYLSWKFEQV